MLKLFTTGRGVLVPRGCHRLGARSRRERERLSQPSIYSAARWSPGAALEKTLYTKRGGAMFVPSQNFEHKGFEEHFKFWHVASMWSAYGQIVVSILPA